LDFSLIFVFAFFFLALISARGAIRLVMVLVPPSSIMVAYFSTSLLFNLKNFIDSKKFVAIVFALLVIFAAIFSAHSLYKSSYSSSGGFIPSSYTQQWQKAMAWVRENTPEDSVFGHWWDYGYWIQSIGERATVLDGGNSVAYWNHLMGRYALTSPNKRDALEFLYAHDTTHFLIDSTDIGKYGAFSAIGSDETYDRRSWIPTLIRDNSQTLENKDEILYVYSGGTFVDEDINYELNGVEIYLPSGSAVLAAVVVKVSSGSQVTEVNGVFVHKGEQYVLPLRYFFNGALIDRGFGVESGIFLFPKITDTEGDGINIEEGGTKTITNLIAPLAEINAKKKNAKTKIRLKSNFLNLYSSFFLKDL